MTLEQIGELLGEIGARDSFTARRTAAADDLHLEVKGVGRLRFPISRTQARKLCAIARPARYGRGEQTLLDKQVRDTWKIPKSRVKIDKRRWNRTLLPMLDALRSDLGLPKGCRLKAELHSMLAYSPGQFFLPHQDSEKADEMVGTLVVTLPSAFSGGVMVVEHQGEKVTYRASRKPLTFIAFYADCRHQIRPVKDGYRIVLTYNLMLAGDGVAAGTAVAEAAPAVVDGLVDLLREHFETPRLPRRHWDEDAPPREPASRLAYLLDHQYTERGLAWQRLKGNDAARATALRSAAERAGCELVLALAEIHETWGCYEPDWDRPRYGRRRHWQRGEDDAWYADHEPPPPDDPDAYELGELESSEVTLDRWIDSSGKKAAPIVTSVDDEELCFTTPSSALEPHTSEYEGYMGNWGNTMDRWYRRAAIVLWPRERAFAVRAEASPAWALEELNQRIGAGELAEAQEMTASLLPIWERVATREERRGFFDQALRVAEGLEEPALATSMLRPFRVEALTPRPGRTLVALVRRYGEGWVRNLLTEWCGSVELGMQAAGRDRLKWLASLPRLCRALRAAHVAAGTLAARLLLQDLWQWLQHKIERWRGLRSPSQRDEALASLARPILGFLESTAVVEAPDLRDPVVTFLRAEDNRRLLPCLVQMLRAADRKMAPATRVAIGLDTVARHCVRLLEGLLERPPRAENDWSITLPDYSPEGRTAGGCGCELCATLEAFLSDPDEQLLEWPIAKAKRMHVHGKLDTHELPVRHETRRLGSPYTLVLTKTEDLFAREAAAHRAWKADLEWLTLLLSESPT